MIDMTYAVMYIYIIIIIIVLLDNKMWTRCE